MIRHPRLSRKPQIIPITLSHFAAILTPCGSQMRRVHTYVLQLKHHGACPRSLGWSLGPNRFGQDVGVRGKRSVRDLS